MLPKALKRVQDTLSLLPGIGEKSALRLAFFLFDSNQRYTQELSSAIRDLKSDLITCPRCYGYSDKGVDMCSICGDATRDDTLLCVVEEYIDMLIIEKSGAYRGYYHVLGGSLSPIHGKHLAELQIHSLFKRVEISPPKEIILAVNPNLEGEATALYLGDHMPNRESIKISRLSKGLPNAGYIEYADDITLINALRGRV